MVGEGERVQRRERGFLDLFFSPRDSFPLLSAHSAAVKREERGERGEREIQREKRHTHTERARERGVKNKGILFKFILIVFQVLPLCLSLSCSRFCCPHRSSCWWRWCWSYCCCRFTRRALPRARSSSSSSSSGGTAAALLSDRVRQPPQPIFEPLPAQSAAPLYVPVVPLDSVERQRRGELGRAHRVARVLLVGEDQKRRVGEVVVGEERDELPSRDADAGAVGAVDDEDGRVGGLVVGRPGRAEVGLAPQVPDLELEARGGRR